MTWVAAVRCPAAPDLVAEVALVLERHVGPVTIEVDADADALLFVPLLPVADGSEPVDMPDPRPEPRTDPPRFQCDICGRVFASSAGLGGHRRVHQVGGIAGRGDAAEAAMVDPAADDEPAREYDPAKTCPHCDTTFTTARRRNNHMLTCQEAPA